MEELIELTAGDKLSNDETLVVFESGTYNKTDLVLVRDIDKDIPYYQYQANYIKNGEIL